MSTPAHEASTDPAVSRAAAARVVAAVLGEGRSLATALPAELLRLHAARMRGATQDLSYNTLRFAHRLRPLLECLLERPLKRRDADIEALLLVGLTQLLELRTPPHAAVASTVDACGLLGKDWARGLCNAVLRRADRERARLEGITAANPEALHAHPRWLVEALRQAWGSHAEAVLEAGNRQPPMTLRVNRQAATREAVAAHLEQAGFPVRDCRWSGDGLRLVRPVDTAAMPGFVDGLFSIQDEAAQLAIGLLALAPGQRVLDACAAPGGKTAHIAEAEPALRELVAIEQDPQRTRLIEDGLRRLRLAATVRTGDAGQPADWWDGQPFDRILLDAPCSASGVIRRHPDIKHLRSAADIPRLASEQQRLLEALWPLLAPGGRLVYVTCSVLPAEGEEVIASFLRDHSEARSVLPAVEWGLETLHGRQTLPGDADDLDGFFYACLEHA
jgi:16S rRNA (cytosine967-C5)-methyltransferase